MYPSYLPYVIIPGGASVGTSTPCVVSSNPECYLFKTTTKFSVDDICQKVVTVTLFYFRLPEIRLLNVELSMFEAYEVCGQAVESGSVS